MHSIYNMFLKELAEDYSYEDLVFIFENDTLFSYCQSRYRLTQEDKNNYLKLLNSEIPLKRYSLENVSMRKPGVLNRVEIVDQDDELKSGATLPLEELSSYPVDLLCSRDIQKAGQLLVSILLEHTFYLTLS